MKIDDQQKMWNILSTPHKRYDPWEDPAVISVDVFFKPVTPVKYIKLDLIVKKNDD